MNSRSLLAFTFIVLALCLGLFWFLRSEAPPPVSGKTPGEARSTERASAGKVEGSANNRPPRTDWQQKIDGILGDGSDETTVGQNLANLLPTLPPVGQAVVAQHIVDLTPDAEYARLVPLVKNTALSEKALEVFAVDLVKRDDKTKLPTLLDVARSRDHSQRGKARAELKDLVGQDHGEDWAKWEESIKRRLQQNAAQEAAAAQASPAPALPEPLPQP